MDTGRVERKERERKEKHEKRRKGIGIPRDSAHSWPEIRHAAAHPVLLQSWSRKAPNVNIC